MLMDVGVNYLREHVEQDTRIHSVISDGGRAPNVVPPEATIWYFVRAPKREQVEAIYARVLDCAKGAALMSGTTYDVEFLTGCYELLPNDVISRIMLAKMDALGPVAFSRRRGAFARDLQALAEPRRRSRPPAARCSSGRGRHHGRRHRRRALHGGRSAPARRSGSCTAPPRSATSARSRRPATCSPAATRSARPATAGRSPPRRAPASAPRHGLRRQGDGAHGLELMTNPTALAAAREEFAAATGGRPYVSPLPEGSVPQ
jgi:aminobenzoyl-glutamate utilization protein B